MSKLKSFFHNLRHNPSCIVDTLVVRYGQFLPDKTYLSLRYRCHMGHWMSWKHPKAFTEKLQCLKVYDFKPWYTNLVDKLAVKKYVADKIGEQYIIPTLAVWNSAEEIDWDSLPEQFVLKTTHGGGGGGVAVCYAKSTFDKVSAMQKLEVSMHSKETYREKPYRKVPRKIIAEQMIGKTGKDGKIAKGELNDYKFFCFGGKCKFFKVDFGRFVDHHANYYSTDDKLLPFGENGLEPDPNHEVRLPSNINDMIAIAEKLSKGFKFLRVDLYNVPGKIYFGELTFYPASGLGPFVPEEWDYKIGELLKL